MKRTALKKVGKIGEANRKARAKIAEIAAEKHLDYCELNLQGCTHTWPLAPAHRHKRAWYKGDVEKLSNFSEWIAACQNCHDLIEHNAELTEEMFKKLRPKVRTGQQNRAIHLWLTQKAAQCRDAGVSPRMAFEKTMELEMTPELMKEIWRCVQKAMFKKQSTTELSKHKEIDDIVEHLNRFFAENFNLEGLALPSYAEGYIESAPLKTDQPRYNR